MSDTEEKIVAARAPFDLVAAIDAAEAELGENGEGSIRLMRAPKGEPDYVLAHRKNADGTRVHARFAMKSPT